MPEPRDSRRVFEGEMIAVTLERWGGADREIVERADSVVVVPVDADDNIVLVRQFRAPTRTRLIELPAGTVDEGEEPLATAKRELEEEAGLSGGSWIEGPVFYTTPGFCRERIHVFFAERLEAGEPDPEPSEDLELVRCPGGEISSVLDEIEDGKTLVGLLLYERSRGAG